MLRILGKIPNDTILACSGGIDSMVLCDFLLKGNKSFSLAFFHHGTETSNQALEFLQSFSEQNNVILNVGYLNESVPARRSKEEFWREKRYEFLRSFGKTILTAHHLDDVIETWIFSSIHGKGKLIPYENNQVLRPLLLNSKEKIINWSDKNNLVWCEDISNQNLDYMRNIIRHEMMDKVLKVNPGIYKTIRKKILEEYKEKLDKA